MIRTERGGFRFGFRVRVSGFGFRVSGFGFRVRVSGSGFEFGFGFGIGFGLTAPRGWASSGVTAGKPFFPGQ
eukprot:2117482-Pyramimonas_sp.AAC.1